jgi:hypothetical protein
MLAKIDPRNPKPAPVEVNTKTLVQPLKKNTASFLTGLVNLFSFKSVKALGTKGLLLGSGIAGGAALAIFAGPQIHAAVIGLAASSAFPPVMIAIAATIGAMLLAFGIYKLVQYSKARLAADKAAKETLAQQQAEAALGAETAGDAEVLKSPAPPTYNAAALQQPAPKDSAPKVQFEEAPAAVVPPLDDAAAAELNGQAKW